MFSPQPRSELATGALELEARAGLRGRTLPWLTPWAVTSEEKSPTSIQTSKHTHLALCERLSTLL